MGKECSAPEGRPNTSEGNDLEGCPAPGRTLTNIHIATVARFSTFAGFLAHEVTVRVAATQMAENSPPEHD
jgi:hypothetical protein